MYKYLGLILAIFSFICLALLTFGYRELSIQLILMFFFTFIGLPLSTFLLIKKKTYFITFNKEDNEELDVVGKFCI